jgi:isoleucyl-tRNA synthetase
VHLAVWPTSAGREDPALDAAIEAVRVAVSLGRGARSEAKIKIRQPLAQAVVACPPATATVLEGMRELIARELNVHEVRFVTDPGELVAVTIKPNYRTLGPRFGKAMPALAAAIAELPGAESARLLEAGEPVTVTVDGAAHELGPDALLITARPTEGYAVGQESGMAVGLTTVITPDLRREGLAREIVHAVQNARRAAGLRVEERIMLHLDGSGPVREAIDAFGPHISVETLVERLSVGHGSPFAGVYREELVLDGEPVAIRIDRFDGDGTPAD